MTQEDKELLLKDLSCRLEYFPMVAYYVTNSGDKSYKGLLEGINLRGTHNELKFLLMNFDVLIEDVGDDNRCHMAKLEDVRPYLRPMSSMTEEEEKKYLTFFTTDGRGFPTDDVDKHKIDEYLDWLNSHYFDYRGLIEKGLAVELPEEDNPYEN